MLFRKTSRALLLILLTLALAGCARAQAQSPAPPTLLGSWYESVSGSEYQFIEDGVLVLPKTLVAGGNAATYRVLEGDKLDVVSGQSHYVSEIESLTADDLVLADPVTGTRQHLHRSLSRTAHLKSLEATAAAKLSRFATMTIEPAIIWVAERPTGKGSQWTTWSPKTLETYGKAWTWATIKRDRRAATTSGGGSQRGYSFSFKRQLPTGEQIQSLSEEASLEATRGLSRIDVGYSASKAQYPAGSVVYLPTGLVFSLGDGYAIALGLDRARQSFVPVTRR